MEEEDGRAAPSAAGDPPHRRLFELVKAVVQGAQKDRLTGLAAEVAFYTMLALPSSLFALFASMGYITDRVSPGTTRRIAGRLLDESSTFLTSDGVETLRDLIASVLAENRSGLFVASIFVAVFSASRATRVFTDAVRIAYGRRELRPMWRRRLAALGVTAIGVVSALVLLPLLALGPSFGGWLEDRTGVALMELVWTIVYVPVVLIGGALLLASFYHLAAPVRTPWRRDLPGAAVALAVWAAATFALRIYTLFSVDRSPVHGTVGGLIVVMLTFYVTAFALLLGAQLNGQMEQRARDAPAEPKLSG